MMGITGDILAAAQYSFSFHNSSPDSITRWIKQSLPFVNNWDKIRPDFSPLFTDLFNRVLKFD
jgi:hypothetical protein